MESLEVVSPTGTGSSGLTYQQLLDTDTNPVPDVLRLESARVVPPVQVPVERYTSQAFHDLEVEKVWNRVWQMACREEDIPEVGDHILYEIAGKELIVVRSGEDTIHAFPNSCLHRGRALRDRDGRSPHLRCPFHGWTWNLDGSLKEVPCRWDFDHVARDEYALPPVKVGTWGGFVFVNLDPDAGPLEDYLGDLPSHFERWPLEKRYKEAHVAKVMPCNWKVVQEAFMEAYHVLATHPQLLPGIGDTNSQYDVWDNFSRAITPSYTPSPHLTWDPSEQDMIDTTLTRSIDDAPLLPVPESMTARQTMAQMARMELRASVPGADQLTDAELSDSIYYTLFPNFHPWGAYNRITYRFRPLGNDPHHSIMEVMLLSPFLGRRPKPAPIHWLGDDEDWTCAAELGFLAKVFNQDTGNLARVQAGLRSARHEKVTFARYQEVKIRHMHTLLNRYLEA